MRVQEIMSRDIETIGADDDAEVARNRMHLRGIHHLVVEANGGIVGIVSDRDLGGPRQVAELKGKRVRDVMSPNIVSVRPESTLRDAANMFRGLSIGCLPVVENKKVIGILTITDLLDLVGRGSTRVPRRAAFVTSKRSRGR